MAMGCGCCLGSRYYCRTTYTFIWDHASGETCLPVAEAARWKWKLEHHWFAPVIIDRRTGAALGLRSLLGASKQPRRATPLPWPATQLFSRMRPLRRKQRLWCAAWWTAGICERADAHGAAPRLTLTSWLLIPVRGPDAVLPTRRTCLCNVSAHIRKAANLPRI